ALGAAGEIGPAVALAQAVPDEHAHQRGEDGEEEEQQGPVVPEAVVQGEEAEDLAPHAHHGRGEDERRRARRQALVRPPDGGGLAGGSGLPDGPGLPFHGVLRLDPKYIPFFPESHPARKARIARITASGSSSWGQCPESGNSATEAWGRASFQRSSRRGSKARSLRPHRSRAGFSRSAPRLSHNPR